VPLTSIRGGPEKPVCKPFGFEVAFGCPLTTTCSVSSRPAGSLRVWGPRTKHNHLEEKMKIQILN